MKKILQITSSINGENSLSSKLTNTIIEKLTREFPNPDVVKRDLVKSNIPHLSNETFSAFRVLPEERTAEHSAAVKTSDDLIDELFAADIIVIGVPFYNFGIPSVLKSWIDHIARAGVTFKYSEKGVEGLLKNKKVYLAISSGGVYSEGMMQGYDFTEPYLRAVLGFVGLTDIETFRIEGIALPEIGQTQIEKGFESVKAFDFQKSTAIAA